MLTKQLRAAFTPNHDIYDNIAIVIVFDLIYKDLNTKTSSLLETGDKTINKIQQILCSTKAKNLTKQATDVIKDLAMFFRGPQSYNNYFGGKQKADSNEQYYNYNRMGHYGRDCNQPDRRRSHTPYS